MISYIEAKNEIEKYFDINDFDKSRISKDVIEGFIESCNSDYDEWIEQMLESYFNDNNQKIIGGKFFFEEKTL